MNNEIKGILSLLNSSSWSNEAKQIEDYITNLQEELKSANESITWWTNRFKAVQQENERLKDTLAKIKDLNTMQYLNEKNFKYSLNEILQNGSDSQ